MQIEWERLPASQLKISRLPAAHRKNEDSSQQFPRQGGWRLRAGFHWVFIQSIAAWDNKNDFHRIWRAAFGIGFVLPPSSWICISNSIWPRRVYIPKSSLPNGSSYHLFWSINTPHLLISKKPLTICCQEKDKLAVVLPPLAEEVVWPKMLCCKSCKPENWRKKHTVTWKKLPVTYRW